MKIGIEIRVGIRIRVRIRIRIRMKIKIKSKINKCLPLRLNPDLNRINDEAHLGFQMLRLGLARFLLFNLFESQTYG